MATANDNYPQLVYQAAIGRHKPFTMGANAGSASCPFCDHSQLPPIVKRDGDILLVPNKYPILRGSDPFVLIETGECESELSLYTEDRLLRVLRMGIDQWREMAASGRYQSVIFIKNHGPMSGGSLRHPHMQIIGFADVDCYTHVRRDALRGPVIHQSPGVELNVSDRPLVGFTEFNILLTDEGAFTEFCLLIQKAVQYTLQYFHHGTVDSYNLFFYDFDGVTYCKVMPRAATTPIFVGYAIPQVTDNLAAVAEDFKKHFPTLP